MNIAIIVPARLDSKRFPNKLLHIVNGKPLIIWTAERISFESGDIPLYFAVEDRELQDLLLDAGYNAIMTEGNFQSGTDRIAKANKRILADYIINVQADEPLICGEHIDKLCNLIKSGGTDVATLAYSSDDEQDFSDPNCVKVVVDNHSNAMYFSRSPIPNDRDGEQKNFLHHIGVYAYTADYLNKITSLPQSSLEKIEKLEQLRVLEHNFKIKVGITKNKTFGVDKLSDIDKIKDYLK
jgi:3-deoxy-manno-octulosonate cytidylyltransferase (CMP-KDO synthetase)